MQQLLNLKLYIQESLFLEDLENLYLLWKIAQKVYRQIRIIEIVFFYHQKLLIKKCNKLIWLE